MLQKISNEIDLRSKLSRLYILSNSYLPKKKLKAKIGFFLTVYTSITESTLNQLIINLDLPFNKFPKRWDFFRIY